MNINDLNKLAQALLESANKKEDPKNKLEKVKSALQTLTTLKDISEVLAHKEYDKLIHALNNSKNPLSDDLEQEGNLKKWLMDNGNALVKENFILPDGRMPNAALLVGFEDKATAKKHVLLIENGKFGEYTTPAGKVDKSDGEGVEDRYQRAALRECAEEAGLDLTEMFKEGQVTVTTTDREGLGIPERDNAHYDSRIFTVNLGKRDYAEMEAMRKGPGQASQSSKDAVSSFWVEADSLLYSSFDEANKEQKGPFTNYYLVRGDKRLKVRPTTVVVLNGSEKVPAFYEQIASPLTKVAAAVALGKAFEYLPQESKAKATQALIDLLQDKDEDSGIPKLHFKSNDPRPGAGIINVFKFNDGSHQVLVSKRAFGGNPWKISTGGAVEEFEMTYEEGAVREFTEETFNSMSDVFGGYELKAKNLVNCPSVAAQGSDYIYRTFLMEHKLNVTEESAQALTSLLNRHATDALRVKAYFDNLSKSVDAAEATALLALPVVNKMTDTVQDTLKNLANGSNEIPSEDAMEALKEDVMVYTEYEEYKFVDFDKLLRIEREMSTHSANFKPFKNELKPLEKKENKSEEDESRIKELKAMKKQMKADLLEKISEEYFSPEVEAVKSLLEEFHASRLSFKRGESSSMFEAADTPPAAPAQEESAADNLQHQ